MTSEYTIPVREAIPVRLTEQIDEIFDMGSTMPDAYNRITDAILLTFQYSGNDKIRELSDHVSALIENHRFNITVNDSAICTIMSHLHNDEALHNFRADLTALIDQFDLAEENLVAIDANPA